MVCNSTWNYAWTKTKEDEGVIMKPNSEKAYNSINWSFMEEFPTKCVDSRIKNWIMQSIGGESMHHINGSNGPYLKT